MRPNEAEKWAERWNGWADELEVFGYMDREIVILRECAQELLDDAYTEVEIEAMEARTR